VFSFITRTKISGGARQITAYTKVGKYLDDGVHDRHGDAKHNHEYNSFSDPIFGNINTNRHGENGKYVHGWKLQDIRTLLQDRCSKIVAPRSMLSSLRLHLLTSQPDALELVHNRRMFPLPQLAHNIRRHVRRLVHRRHPPRHDARVPAAPGQRIRQSTRAAAPATLWLAVDAVVSAVDAANQRRREQRRHVQHDQETAGGVESDRVQAEFGTADAQGVVAYAAVCGGVLYYAVGHVLQWIHPHVHLHRRLSWVLCVWMGVGRYGVGSPLPLLLLYSTE
jgi:hypothetical protein